MHVHSHALFCSLNLLFSDLLVTVVVVVCLSSLLLEIKVGCVLDVATDQSQTFFLKRGVNRFSVGQIWS